MANGVISLGLGSPTSIGLLTLFGLGSAEVAAPDVIDDMIIRIRSRRTIPDGGLLTQESVESLSYLFDYDADHLPAGVELASAGTVVATPSGLTVGTPALVTGGRKVRAQVSGGTIGVKYTIRHTVATDEVPAQTKSKWFTLRILG